MAASAVSFGHPPISNKPNPGTAIRVANVRASVSVQQVISLFSSQIGPIKCFYECGDEHGRCLEISFHSRDAAKRSLCMDGYALEGSHLSVTLLHPQKPDSSKKCDQRRNLYVLGLPFELTKPELAALFEPFGTVLHCVILATVDNASRRRGFVVMSTHEQASLAMNALSQTPIYGHTLDISWAVVQRSQGFLDGGDRNVALESPLPNCSFDANPNLPRLDTPASVIPSLGASSLPPLAISILPTNLLLVKNLPSFLFSQVSDLQPLFYPFGSTKNIQLLSSTENDRLNHKVDTLRTTENTVTTDSISVIVEFDTTPSAEDAKMYLHGQVYSDLVVAVNFLSQQPPKYQRNEANVLPYPGCFVDPYPYTYAPHYMPRTLVYDTALERHPYYAGPLPYGLTVVPPLYTGHNSSPYSAPPYTMHLPYAPLSTWPHLGSRSSSTDSSLESASVANAYASYIQRLPSA